MDNSAHFWRVLTVFFLLATVVCPLLADWMRHRPAHLERPTQHLVLLGLAGLIFFLACASLSVMHMLPLLKHLHGHSLS